MEYKDLLKKYIAESGLSLSKIEEGMRDKGFSTNKAYISKLQNGVYPPAGEDITRALAEVTGGDPEALLLAGYIEKAPNEVQDQLRAAHRYHVLFMLVKFLVDFLEEYREHGVINEEYLEKVEFAKEEVSRELKYYVETDGLPYYPELAANSIATVKRAFFYGQDSIKYGSFEIDFTKYVKPDGNPIFLKNPYPELHQASLESEINRLDLEVAEQRAQYKAALATTNDKVKFLEDLEHDLGIDINDPEIRKKLKRAAKIAFIDEE